MHIRQIRLVQFRNYESLRLSPGKGLNVLVGSNAAGKTNLIEAIFLCSVGRSHRTRHDDELIQMGTSGGSVLLELENATGLHHIHCKLRENARKTYLIDNTQLTRSGELLGCLNVVLFAPEDLNLIKQGPSERRRFLDMQLSQLRPAYYYRLQQYNAALKQRNALLKSDQNAAFESQLQIWDEQLAALGESIVRARAAFCDQLHTFSRELHTLFASGEELDVIYRPHTPVQENLRDALYSALCAQRQKDILRGTTSVGPHRDDIAILVNGLDARTYASQGQQRTAALSVKLSQVSLVQKIKGETPVLLLDDVLSELDESRQKMLAFAMQNCQTFLTCTQLAGISAYEGDMQIFHVENGTICVEGPAAREY
ncbi:MAG: DNA replication/repair protein RecF [Clostridia bacterium]|nr:DNA replication/repair protein RecF [Clostridia bacterium]